MTTPTPLLIVEDIWKAFDAIPVLRGVSCSLVEGDIVAVLGPSGCGKSTLLRVITGLEQADRGRVLLNGQPIDAQPIHQRGMGLMFQDWALFPHRTVAENIAFGLRMHAWKRPALNARVKEMLALVGLVGYERRSIFELSGGERQRVALARALAPRPSLLLLDEPLGSLDRTLRERLTLELRSIIRGAGVTALYVTHDQIEAFTVADRLVLMEAGLIAQTGTPQAIYQAPASAFVARFLGLNNILAYRNAAQRNGTTWIETDLGPLELHIDYAPTHGYAVIRPEAAILSTANSNQHTGIINNTAFQGNLVRVQWQHPSGTTLELDAPNDHAWHIGEPWQIHLAPQAISVLPPSATALEAD